MAKETSAKGAREKDSDPAKAKLSALAQAMGNIEKKLWPRCHHEAR